MKEIKIEKLNAVIYIDEWSENADKIRVYDSNREYLDYYEPDTIIELAEQDGVSEEQWLDEETKNLANVEDINELLDKIGVSSYTVAKNDDLTPILDDFAESYDYDNQLSDMGYLDQIKWLKDNEWINFIGDYVIHIFQ